MTSQHVLRKISLNDYESGTGRDIKEWLVVIFIIFNALLIEK